MTAAVEAVAEWDIEPLTLMVEVAVEVDILRPLKILLCLLDSHLQLL